MFYVDVRQEAGVVEVRIRMSPEQFSGSISAFAVGDMDGSDGMAVYVKTNVSFHNDVLSATVARNVGKWFAVAAQAADTLAFHIRERDDFRKPVRAKSRGGMVTVMVGDRPIGPGDGWGRRL